MNKKLRPTLRSWLWPAGVVVVVVVAAAAYGPTVDYPYVQDAVQAVQTNPVVERGGLAEILTSHYWKGYPGTADRLYRPVVVASFAMERRVLGSLDPAVSHLRNVVLHALTAILLLFYVRRIGGGARTAATAALLFASHPLLLQGVASVVGRADVLAASFSLAALLAASWSGSFRDGPSPSPSIRRAAAWGAAALLFLALGSKEIAVATPFLLLAQETLFRTRDDRPTRSWWIERAAALAPCGLAIVAWLTLRTIAVESLVGLQTILPMNNVLVGVGGVERVATTLAMAGRYAKLLVWPVGLSADYSGAAIPVESSVLAPLAILGVIVLLLAGLGAASPALFRRSSHASVFSMGALLFLLPYLVVGNLLVPNGAGFAERLMYFPATGFCIVLGAALGVTFDAIERRNRRAARIVAVTVVGALVTAGVWRIRAESPMWASELALHEHTLRSTPASLRARFGLAELYARAGRTAEAIPHYRAAVTSAPDHAPSWLYLGVALGKQGDLAGAESAIRRAIAIRPDVAEAHLILAMVLDRTGRPDEAQRSRGRALALQPGLARAVER